MSEVHDDQMESIPRKMLGYSDEVDVLPKVIGERLLLKIKKMLQNTNFYSVGK